MFSFDNINKVIEGKAMIDTTPITRLDDELTQKVLTATYTLGMSDRLTGIVKSMIAKMGIIKDHNDETVAVNAICFFSSPVKGMGALLNDPEFRIYELDASSANVIVTDYVAGGIIRRDRDIDGYNKSRQFHKDDIECIVPINSRGAVEYQKCDQYIMNLVNKSTVDINVNTVDDATITEKVFDSGDTLLTLESRYVSPALSSYNGDVSTSVTSDNSPWNTNKIYTTEVK